MIDKFTIPAGHEDISNAFYREIWHGNEYNQYGIKIDRGDIVLDCGSNIGIFTDYALFNGAKKVYAFEASSEMVDAYKKTFPPTENLNVKNFNAKIGYGQDCWDLKKIFEYTREEKFDFAKIDIEGFEYDLLLNTPDLILQRIDKWAIEFHLWGYWENTGTEMKLLLKVIEKFNSAGFDTYLKHIHADLNLIMFYAKKKN